MKKESMKDDPTILEAVDNLSSMAELDLDELKESKKEGGKGIKGEPIRLQKGAWLDLKDQEKTLTSVKSTFRVVHNYLKHIYTKESGQLRDIDVQKGVKSIMALAGEAAEKIDAYAKLFKGKEGATHSKEYRELIEFYENKILKRFEEVLESEEKWEEEWKEEGDAADIRRRGLRDLETVTKDRDYELFYIRREDGSPFFNKNLLRHIRMVADFDQIIGSISKESDPLIKVQIVQDQRAQKTALLLKNVLKKDMDSWIRKAGKFRDDPFVQTVSSTLYALFLAKNPHNLLLHTMGKSSISYFKDFQFYLQNGLESINYQNIMEGNVQEEEPFYREMTELLHKMAFFFYRARLDESEGYALLERLIGEEESLKGSVAPLSLWNFVLDANELLRSKLAHFPSGPLFKTLDILHHEEDREFDPIRQGDLPEQVFSIRLDQKEVHFIRAPAPLRQRQIDKAEFIPEFTAFARALVLENKKALIVNMQDRTSWKEFARAHKVEELEKSGEFKDVIDVITLPKQTDFYYQADEYLKLNEAKEFKTLFLQQIKSREECGFFFPKRGGQEVFDQFIQKSIDFVHENFFNRKEHFSRKNRLDFIEVIYQFIILKQILVQGSDIVIVMGKDGVDLSPLALASLYGFFKMISENTEWKEEERERFLTMIFLPALLVRERAPDITVLYRAMSFLALFSGEMEIAKQKLIAPMEKLFSTKLKVQF